MRFPESKLAHEYLDGLKGIEIGEAAHNPFGLDTLNVDISAAEDIFIAEQMRLCGEVAKVDIVAPGDDLPFKNGELDFVISSHVLEHFADPISAIIEWCRVIKPGGMVFMIVPHAYRTDEHALRVPLQHHIDDYFSGVPGIIRETQYEGNKSIGHQHAWITEDLVRLVAWMQYADIIKTQIIDIQDTDDKVGNGFTIVLMKYGE